MKNYHFIISIFILALFTCFSCKNNNDKKINNNPIESNYTYTSESFKVIVGFLSWYKENYNCLTEIELIKSKRINDINTYKVDWNAINKYLSYFEKSHYFSKTYLTKILDFVREKERVFNSNTNLEIPEGFDYDWFLYTQDCDSYFSHLDNIKVIKEVSRHNKNCVHIKIGEEPDLLFFLECNDNIWQIDSISNDTLMML